MTNIEDKSTSWGTDKPWFEMIQFSSFILILLLAALYCCLNNRFYLLNHFFLLPIWDKTVFAET